MPLSTLNVPGSSSSWMISVATAGVPSAALPVGAPRASMTLRLPPTRVLLRIGTLNDLVPTLTGKVRTPDTVLKSTSGTAVSGVVV